MNRRRDRWRCRRASVAGTSGRRQALFPGEPSQRRDPRACRASPAIAGSPCHALKEVRRLRHLRFAGGNHQGRTGREDRGIGVVFQRVSGQSEITIGSGVGPQRQGRGDGVGAGDDPGRPSGPREARGSRHRCRLSANLRASEITIGSGVGPQRHGRGDGVGAGDDLRRPSAPREARGSRHRGRPYACPRGSEIIIGPWRRRDHHRPQRQGCGDGVGVGDDLRRPSKPPGARGSRRPVSSFSMSQGSGITIARDVGAVTSVRWRWRWRGRRYPAAGPPCRLQDALGDPAEHLLVVDLLDGVRRRSSRAGCR